MLLSLPKLQYAGVNSLLLHVNKQALFIHHPVYKTTGAVKLFLSPFNLIFSFLQTLFCDLTAFTEAAVVQRYKTAYAEQRPLSSLIQINKGRGMA
jgi:hypothetical protein